MDMIWIRVIDFEILRNTETKKTNESESTQNNFNRK